MHDPDPALEKIADFLQTLTTFGGLNLKSQILACNGQVQPTSSDPAGAIPPTSCPTTLPKTTPSVCVDLTGPDTPLLLARNGELLHAIEHIAAKILRLEPEDHDRIFFDAEGFKANRDRELYASAEAAIQKVRASGRPYAFPPMTSRERRMLHLALADSGLASASSGENPRRFVVLYPEGQQPIEPTQIPTKAPTSDRTQAIRNTFRRR